MLPGLESAVARTSAAPPTVPVFAEGNDTADWVGSTVCKFEGIGILQGRIMYTLDGTRPQRTAGGSTKQYTNAGITITHSLTVTAIHVQNGDESEQATQYFRKARTPLPTIACNGPSQFTQPITCTLKVASTSYPDTIRFTRDGTPPTSASPISDRKPFVISKTETVKAYAIAQGHEASDPMSATFTYLEPPPAPTVTPGSQNFSTGTLALKVTCPSAATSCRYSDKPGAIDLATAGTLLTSDAVTIHGEEGVDTVYFRVQAFKTGYPASTVTLAKYAYLPAVATPTILPAPTAFYDTLTVKLSSTTPNAIIRYVEDASVPTMASKDGSRPILLSNSVTLGAIAFKGAQPPSAVARFPFTLRLTPPIPDKPTQDYVDSLKIKFTAKNPKALIFYTLNGTPPAIVNGAPTGTLYDAAGVTISAVGTTVVSAIAFLDGIASTASTNSYLKKEKVTSLEIPSFDPPGVEFVDSTFVTLVTEQPNSEVRYTLSASGQEPTRQSLLARKGVPIRLDSTVTLWSRTFPINGSTLDSSSLRRDKYTLLPSQPTATPLPIAPFANSVTVTLRTRTRNGTIHYTLNDERPPVTAQGFRDSVKVVLSSTTVLRAVTVAGSPPDDHFSSTLVLTYEIYTNTASDTLGVGVSRGLAGGHSFVNNSPGAIIARPGTNDALGLAGFDNLSLTMTLQPAQPGAQMKVGFLKNPESPAWLYRMSGGKPEFVTADARADLTVPGTYFLGVDVQPPVLALVKQIPAPGDSTTVHFRVTDNVLSPTLEVASAGVSGGKTSRKPDPDGLVVVNLKSKQGDPTGLWLRATAADRIHSVSLPAPANGRLYLSQVWSKLATPAVLNIGDGAMPWDLAGFPVSSTAPLDWNQLRAAYPGMQACSWSEAAGKYLPLEDTAKIGPGQAVWLASRNRVASVNLAQFRAGESEQDGTWRIRLRPGWNQVTSPSLDRVHWPVTVAKSKLPTSLVKAPYRYVRDPRDPWVQSDSLDPWIGYFVLYYGTRDTVITLYSTAAQRPVSKTAAAEPEPGLDLSLHPALGMPVRLGARTWARDGIGTEDEPNLPVPDRSHSAWALRGRRGFMTDVVRFVPDEVMHWDVVLEPGNGTALEALAGKVTGTLPGGYEAWAVSAHRGLKFRLEPGHPLPASDARDTLSIYAGPSAKLAAIGELSRAALTVERFAYALEQGRGATWLRLELPWPAQVDAALWTTDGKRLGRNRGGSLNTGVYRLRMESGTGTQPVWLRLRVLGPDGMKEHSRRISR